MLNMNMKDDDYLKFDYFDELSAASITAVES